MRYAYRPDDAEAAFQKALKLDPNYLNAHKNRGTLHAWLGNIEQAIESYRKAKRLSPDEAETHRNLGVIYLLQGKLILAGKSTAGDGNAPKRPPFPTPSPSGPDKICRAKRFSFMRTRVRRFAPLHSLCGRTQGERREHHCSWPTRLTALFQGCKGIDWYIPNSIPIQQPFDYHCSLIDVADVLQINDKNIPYGEGYIRSPQYLIDYWKNWKLKLPPAKMYVGIAWQGNKDHQADQFVPTLSKLTKHSASAKMFSSLVFSKDTVQTKSVSGRESDHLLYCQRVPINRAERSWTHPRFCTILIC